jgi:hypothetical protein
VILKKERKEKKKMICRFAKNEIEKMKEIVMKTNYTDVF